jgi:hypothetical protein
MGCMKIPENPSLLSSAASIALHYSSVAFLNARHEMLCIVASQSPQRSKEVLREWFVSYAGHGSSGDCNTLWKVKLAVQKFL